MNAAISVICYKSKTLSNGEHPLMLRVIKNRKISYKSLKVSVNAKFGDFDKNITRMDKESFVGAFDEWHEKYKDVLNERVHDKRIKRYTPPYMRPRLRSAYLSLKRNMPLLWTYYDHPETGLPNTNNGIEGLFSDTKSKLRAHRGIGKNNRMKLIDEYILRHY